MKTTRLAYLISQYPSISHTFILREVLALRDLGLHIRVASINPPDRPHSELTEEERVEAATTFCVKKTGGVPLLTACMATLAQHPFGWLSGLMYSLRLGGTDARRMAYGLFYFAEALLLGRWMAREHLHHLHVHFATPASTVGLIATKIFPIGLSITVHGPDEFYDISEYSLREKIAGASFICAIGKFARSQLMKISPPAQWSKFEVSPLGVDPVRFGARPAAAGQHIFELICVGRLVPAKGQHVLIAAVGRMVREGQQIRLRLVGNGPDRESLEREVAHLKISESVIFEGAVNQDRIRSLYQAADLFVLPSFAEGIPVVLMEAMSMEIPVLTTFVNGIPELIRHEIDGWLVAPSDVDGLASAISILMKDPSLRLRLGRAGRERILDRYNLGPNCGRLAEIFQRRLGGLA